jgi:hypothetical protein
MPMDRTVAVKALMNLVSAVSAVAISVTLARQYVGTTPATAQENTAGATHGPARLLRIPDWDFARAKNTLVMALTTDCRFAPESAEFYEEVVTRAHGYEVLVLVESNAAFAKAALSETGLPLPEVRQVDFATLKIDELPTLLLADSAGKMVARWSGATIGHQTEVLRRLGLPVSPSEARAVAFVESDTGSHIVDTARLIELGRSGTVPIVDVRQRREFEQAHVAGAISMPLDELSTRGEKELPTKGTVIAMCGPCPDCEGGSDASRLQHVCVNAFQAFVKMGFEDVRMYMRSLDDLPDLQRVSGVEGRARP